MYNTFLSVGSKSSWSILGDYTSIDIENEIFTTQNFDTLIKEEMGKLFSKESTEKFFSLGKELYKLNLNQDQLNGLRAFVIFNPGKLLACFLLGFYHRFHLQQDTILPKCGGVLYTTLFRWFDTLGFTRFSAFL